MILERDAKQHIGKTVADIRRDDGLTADGLVMCESLVIVFTDGSQIKLRTDWRGADCYISEYMDARSFAA